MFNHGRHPGESRGPVKFSTRAGFSQGHLDGLDVKALWIPAFAGMTLLVMFALYSTPVIAADKAAAKSPKLDPALCQNLVEYQEPPGVEYQPGVDADGNPVAPADLPGQQQIQLPKKIEIPLTISLAKAVGLDTTQYPYNQLGPGTEMKLGTITVEGRKVLFNGKPLADPQQAKLSALCQKQWGVHGP